MQKPITEWTLELYDAPDGYAYWRIRDWQGVVAADGLQDCDAQDVLAEYEAIGRFPSADYYPSRIFGLDHPDSHGPNTAI